MSKYLLILGRQPALGLAELESLYGSTALEPVGNSGAMLDIEADELNFPRLGGSVKLCKLLNIIDSTKWFDLEQYLAQNVIPHTKYLPAGKMKLGISTYELDVSPKSINQTALKLKKIIARSGRSVRVIPNKSPALNSAQVIHNHLTGDLGWELVFIKDKGRTILAQTIQEQDIEAYAARDQARPKRDAKVGMLPPKLAQIIINLAVGQYEKKDLTILDPFCGTGVILQEALLMGYNAIGSDSEPRMIDYAKINILEWLIPKYGLQLPTQFCVADATSAVWQEKLSTAFDVIASETYLGRAFSSPPKPEILNKTIQDVNMVVKKFLNNLAAQVPKGFKLSLALPAWLIAGGFKHLPLLDQLTDIGYTPTSFIHVQNRDLIYHREGQFVGRELVVLTRNVN